MDVSATMKKFGLEAAFKYLQRDPERNLLRLMDWADRFAGDEFVSQRKMIRDAMTDPEHPYYGYVRHIIHDLDTNVMETVAVNFFINAALTGWPVQERNREKYRCNS
jgi:prophage DNA circulation protein